VRVWREGFDHWFFEKLFFGSHAWHFEHFLLLFMAGM